MDINWTTNNQNQPVAWITPDNGGDSSVTSRINGVTGVDIALGINPIEVTFYSEGNVGLAMRPIIQILGSTNHIIGNFRDSKSGVQWP